MRIFCTRKLSDYIGSVNKDLPSDCLDQKFSDWNAHLFNLNRKKCLIFVHNQTHYTVFLTGVVKKDLQNIEDIFIRRLFEQLEVAHITLSANMIDKLTLADGIEFYKTNNNKKILGRINDFTYQFKLHCEVKYGHISEMDIIREIGLINQVPITLEINGKKTWTNPTTFLRELNRSNK